MMQGFEKNPRSNRREEVKSGLELRLIERQDDVDLFSNLLDHSFLVPKGEKFFDDFPVWDPRNQARSVRVGIFKKKELASCAGMRFCDLKTPIGILPVAIIGAVATHPEWRGLGLASDLVDFLTNEAKKKGAALCLLWGSNHELYRRLDFELCGIQVVSPLSNLDLSTSTVETIKRGWNFFLFQRLKQREQGLALGDQDLSWYSLHKNVEWFWTGPQEYPTAYAAYGRGIDLKNMVHEWGGNPEDLKHILAVILEKYPDAQILGSPLQFEKNQFSYDLAQAQYLCMAKVLDAPKIIQAYSPGKKIEVTSSESEMSICFDGFVADHLKPKDLSVALFGPEVLHDGWKSTLPLPFWIWGLDSA